MTLTSAKNAAREDIRTAVKRIAETVIGTEGDTYSLISKDLDVINNATRLPAKPMTEDEICRLMLPWITGSGANVELRMACAYNILYAMKAATCLYVEEK